MSGILLLLPFLLIRFGLLAVVNIGAVKRAAYFAPMRKNESWIYWIYQISNIAIFVSLCFLKIKADDLWWFYAGTAFYVLGLVFCAASIVSFAIPSEEGLNTNGIYRFSRNPMYLSYFMIFLGFACMTASLILGGIVMVFIVASHWIILAEERWCIAKFGGAYRQYMQRVRRYL